MKPMKTTPEQIRRELAESEVRLAAARTGADAAIERAEKRIAEVSVILVPGDIPELRVKVREMGETVKKLNTLLESLDG